MRDTSLHCGSVSPKAARCQDRGRTILRVLLDTTKIPWVATHLCDAKRKEFGIRKPGFKLQLCCLFAVWLWKSLNFSRPQVPHNRTQQSLLTQNLQYRDTNANGTNLCKIMRLVEMVFAHFSYPQATPGCLEIPPLFLKQVNIVASGGQ